MSRLTLRTIDSVAELRQAAPLWDDLWQRSEVTLPSARAELMAQWLEHFEPKARFTAWVVEQDGRLLAALPLIEVRAAGVVKLGRLPGNDWCPAAELLLDPAAPAESLDLLIGAINGGRWPIVAFDAVNLLSAHWQAFVDALDRAGNASVEQTRFRIGIVDVGHDWSLYEASRSSSHRRHMRKSLARAQARGPVALKVYEHCTADEVEELLLRGFEIENASWKGAAGSSVLESRGIFEFYLRQACQLAAWGQLKLVFLECAGRPIAFEYGWNAKGVYHSLKVGYDAAAAAVTPGQLLRLRLLEQFHAEGQNRWVDFLGPLTPATQKWTTRSYPMSRLIVAAEGRLGRILLDAYQWSKGLSRREVEPPLEAEPTPILGVAASLPAGASLSTHAEV